MIKDCGIIYVIIAVFLIGLGLYGMIYNAYSYVKNVIYCNGDIVNKAIGFGYSCVENVGG